jgi:lipopolysaccharide cholinephosphotransferase
MQNYSMKQIQAKILEIMIYVDALCRENNIDYYIMGGTALGAIRHQGFIPWDDDLDIFMTPDNYEKFKSVLLKQNDKRFEIQEWRLDNAKLEYAKVRMNGTTFIEANFKNNRNMHHGVYIDIMILHKCPKSLVKKYQLFLYSRYVTTQALAERNWTPKTRIQSFFLRLVRLLPKYFMSDYCYRQIYKYDRQIMQDHECCYFLTKARFKQSIFPKEIFMKPVDIPFETIKLSAPTDIHGYLKIRFGNYMVLPPEKERKAAKHAEIVDLDRDYKEYFM